MKKIYEVQCKHKTIKYYETFEELYQDYFVQFEKDRAEQDLGTKEENIKEWKELLEKEGGVFIPYTELTICSYDCIESDKIVGELMSLALQIKGNMYAHNKWFAEKLNELKECIFRVK